MQQRPATQRSFSALAIRQTAAIAGTTLREAIQQPVALLILLCAVVTTLLVPVFQFHRFSEDGRLARDSGLSCLLIFGLILAATTAGRTVADEIARGTAAAALGKPVGRATFLLAKWMGACAAILLFWLTLTAATLLAERGSAHFIVKDNFTGYVTDIISLALGLGGAALALLWAALRNYFQRRRFGLNAFMGLALSQPLAVAASGFYNRLGEPYPLHGEAACCGAGHSHSAGAWLLYHPELDLRIVPAALLILLILLVFAALATALATRLRPGTTLALCAATLALGLASDSLLSGATPLSLRGLAAGILPDVQNFWLCDALAHGGRISLRYLAKASLYALTCCALFLSLGCAAFEQRDLD